MTGLLGKSRISRVTVRFSIAQKEDVCSGKAFAVMGISGESVMICGCDWEMVIDRLGLRQYQLLVLMSGLISADVSYTRCFT